ncbi:cation-translocating P-type ATPase [Jannaschia formosa]|uniref:cation-translocating P-type ATPase n=1 Tax=Jannaschia formosa TaxID=2259592 RepID=UPI000E1B6C47|nr:HAD-IC family P-type ATPase [Jannaschia formosa]TFL16383.1 HAD family hydrolase [Jannaschia formosa]
MDEKAGLPSRARTRDPADAPLHALEAGTVLARLGVGAAGLSTPEAEARLARHGPNALPEVPPRGALARLGMQFNNVLILVLVGAAAVTALLGHWIDTGVIAAVILVNALVGYWQEGRAESAMRAVRAMLRTSAATRRDGDRVTIEARGLVPGDVVMIEAGDRVPADLRLIEARSLRTDEAALTGEATTVDKQVEPVAADAPLGDRASLAHSGTLVTAGRGVGVVVATGAEAEIGRIGTMLGDVEALRTPLLAQIDRFSKWLTALILAACAAVFAFGVWRGGWDGAEGTFLAVVGMAVAAIPEGLPAVMTITLALGVQRMAARRAIVRRLPAVETLGAVSVICTDKTGTLTLNEMVVRTVALSSEGPDLRVTGAGYAPEGTVEGGATPMLGEIALCGMLCNDAALVEGEAGWSVAGDPMDGALLALAQKAGLDEAAERASRPRLDDIPFDARHRFMAVLAGGMDGVTAFVKGAPHRVLDMCATGPDGAQLDRAAWDARADALAAAGQRVLGFAARDMGDAPGLRMEDMNGLRFLGLIGFVDPPRPEAAAAIAGCRAAGIAVKMITGDHALTALAVAREIGLDTGAGAVTGDELMALEPEALRRRAAEVGVIARAAPEHKLRLVEALQANGAIVAMTGDGVNDAPALKRADVGIAMGIKGTEAAKEAARAVLADDNFATIVAAVREGRTIYDNIRKVIAWNLPTNGGESLIVIVAILLGLTLPLSPAQILWINMVSAVALGLTLAFEPAEPGVMDRPPRRRDAGLLDREMVWRVALVSTLFALAAFWLFFRLAAEGRDLAHARTAVVNLLVVLEIAYLFSVRYLSMTALTWQGVLGTPAVLLGVTGTVLAQLAFTYAPPFQAVFDTRPLAPGEWALIVAMGAGLLLLLEAEKAVRRRLLA